MRQNAALCGNGLKGLSIYRHLGKCMYLIQRMSRNVQSKTEWRCLIYGLQQMLQNITEFSIFILLFGKEINGVIYSDLSNEKHSSFDSL